MVSVSLANIEKTLESKSVIYLTDLANALEKYIESGDDIDYEDEEDTLLRLQQLASAFENDRIEVIGIDEDYHNLSVWFAKMSRYDDACRILDRGLEEWNNSITLQASYLNYARHCNKSVFEKCDIIYKKLRNNPFIEWTWQAFSFSLDYLMAKKKRTSSSGSISDINKELLLISEEFCRQENSDQAFFDRYTVLDSLGERFKADMALSDGAKLKIAPRCCLKMADIKFDKGNYAEANVYLERCLKVLSVQPAVNKGYASLLLALSKTSLFMEGKPDFGNIDDETKSEIKKLYKAFDVAFDTKELNAAWKKTANTVISVIETQTGIKKDEDEYFD